MRTQPDLDGGSFDVPEMVVIPADGNELSTSEPQPVPYGE